MSAKKDAAPVGLIPLAEAKTAAAPVVAAQRSEVDPVEKWTTEGAPAWEREGAPQPSGITTTTVPRPTPDPDVEAAGEVTPEAKAEEGAPQASASAAPPAEGEAPTTPKAAEVPDAAAKAAEAPAPAAPPAPAPVEAPKPKTYAADEKIGLAENVEWTRGQVVEALKERVSLQERVPQLETELKTFAQTFGYPTAKEAAEAWEPALSRLRANVPLAELTDYVIMADNPEFHAYLRQAIDYYNQETGAAAPALGSGVRNAAPVAPAQPATIAQLPPDVQRELAAARQFRERAESQQAIARVQSEIQVATSKYPFLASDAGLMGELLQTGQMLYNMDKAKGVPEEQCRGILHALAAKASIYDAVLVARQQRQPEPAPVAAPSPSLLGAQGGAAPAATRQQPKFTPKSSDLDQITNDWLATESQKFER